MKKILFVLAVCFTFSVTYAQYPADVAKRTAERKLGQKLNDALDKAVGKAIDSAFTKKPKSKEQNPNDAKNDNGEAEKADKTLRGLGEQMGKVMDFDAKPNSSYTFKSSIVQKMTLIDKKKTETSYMKILFGAGQPSMGINFINADKKEEAEKGTIIMDMEQKAFYMFTTDKKGQKSYFGMRLKDQKYDNTSTTDGTKSLKPITPTGKYKTIMGYKCEGYQMDGDRGDTFIFWVTESRIASIESYAEAMRQYNTQQRRANPTADNIVTKLMKEGKSVLGHDYTSKDGDQMLTEMESFNPNDPSSFNTEGYKSAFNK